MGRKVYNTKNDQRELMKVIQRNFRKFQGLRDWGWFIIIQKTRPLIGQIDLTEELALLETKAKKAYGAYEEQVNNKKRMEQENVEMEDEKKALMAQLQAEQGNLSEYTDRQTAANIAKTKLESGLVDAGNKLVDMEAARQQAALDKKALEGDNVVIKKDIEDLEISIQKLEQEKTNRDHTIRTLNDEIANQDEVINKLNKEKKHVSENAAKSLEDLAASEDKVDHLAKIKAKLEATLDELQGSLNSEKRARADIEKARRRVEGDLKVTQESVSELERQKKEAESAIGRKEKDLTVLNSKLDDEQQVVSKVQKSIKEIQSRVEELEEELEAERQARAKAERQRSDLAKELESLGERLNEAGGATHAQVELNKKREAEVGKLRKDLEEVNIQHESTLMHETADVRAATDEIGRSKASAEKSNKGLLGSLNDANKKVEEATLTLGDFENNKRKIAAENADLLRQLQELENQANMLAKLKAQLTVQLDEARMVADDEAKERAALLGKFKNLEHELDGVKEHLDEESGIKEDLLRQVAKASNESDMWRSKYETEGVAKAKVAADIEDMAAQADQAQLLNASMEKKAKQFDKLVNEWKLKAESTSMDLDTAQKECRNASSELFRVKSAYEESVLQLDEVRKENKVLSNEIKDIMDQISEGGRSIHEIDKIRKRLEAEKMELQAALEEAEGSLEQEENKVLRAQ